MTNEIRFSAPQALEPAGNDQLPAKRRLEPPKKRWFKTIVLIVLVLSAILAVNKYFFRFSKLFSGNEDFSYYAAFLTNGHIYFGQLEKNNEEEFVLKNVYYLQLTTEEQIRQAQLPEPKFSLVKLGDELHGPTNEIFINKAHMLFYEKLKEDSAVVQLIKNE